MCWFSTCSFEGIIFILFEDLLFPLMLPDIAMLSYPKSIVKLYETLQRTNGIKHGLFVARSQFNESKLASSTKVLDIPCRIKKNTH